MTDTETVEQFRDRVLAAIAAPPTRYSAVRYPHTYAADFLRSHRDLVPRYVLDQLVVVHTRGEASRAIKIMARHMGLDPADNELTHILADAYLIEHNVHGHGRDFSKLAIPPDAPTDN